MGKRTLLVSFAFAAVISLGIGGFASPASAACLACGNFGENCTMCQDDGTCGLLSEQGHCSCWTVAGGGCISWTNCYYSTSCTIADGGRLDCPLQPLKSFAVPVYTKKATPALREKPTDQAS